MLYMKRRRIQKRWRRGRGKVRKITATGVKVYRKETDPSEGSLEKGSWTNLICEDD